MSFANLTLLEFGLLMSAAAAVTVALYLLSLARKQVVVSTLKFWQAARQATERKRRRRIDEPWSLLMQLLALACLLLAVAQPRWGAPEAPGRDHVLLIDTSAWMGARGRGRLLIDAASERASDWVKRLPAEDRVMVVEAGALPSPRTAFTKDRAAIARALTAAKPGAGALDLEQAFALATQAQRLQSPTPGEIVYAGAGRVGEAQPETIVAPPNLRVLEVEGAPENVGIVRLWLRREEAEAGAWRVFVTVRNDSAARRNEALTLALGGAVAGSRLIDVGAGAEATAQFVLRTSSAGWVEARIDARDGFAADNRAVVEIPEQPRLKVQVYSPEPELLRTLLEADGRTDARFAAPGQYRADVEADLVVIDRFAPPSPPQKPALWIEPPPQASPVAAQRFAGGLEVSWWNTSHRLGAGLRSRDLKLESGVVFTESPGDIVVAEAGRRALIVARPGEKKLAVVGYHPGRPAMRNELTAPLLTAHLLEWFAPEVYLRREVLAGPPGTVRVEMEEALAAERVRVIDSQGRQLPFTLDDRTLTFFTAEADTVRVIAGQSEKVYSLGLPDAGRSRWQAGEGVKRGLGERVSSSPVPKDLWPWFAIAGAVLLLAEWLIFGRRRAHTRRERVWMAVLKFAACALALAAVVEPSVAINETKMAVSVLLDASGSVSDKDLERGRGLAGLIDSASGRNEVRVLPFARGVTKQASGEPKQDSKGRATGETGRATNIEGALREAITVLPQGRVPRLVLVSDGRETLGSAARAAYQARQLGIPIDTYALEGRERPRLRLVSVRAPAVAFTGEKIPIELTVESPEQRAAALEIQAEGRTLGTSAVQLERGENQLAVSAAIVTPGAISVSITLKAGDLGELRMEQAVALRRPRLLLLSQDPPGMEQHFMGVLRAGQFDVVEAADLRRVNLDDYQLVVFNNFDLESLPRQTKAGLEGFVQRGGGMVVIGGERNIYVDKKGQPADPLDRALPATVAPPRSPEGTAVVLIVDKSSSMEGRKMELARLAAIGVVENLRPIDFVGVLIFDNSHQWAVPLRRAEDKTMIKRLVAGITPDGGTQIAPALAESYRRMLTGTGAYKHIVLLTDGISEEGDSVALAKEAGEKRITISTVGLGQDVNRTYLEKVAAAAKGKSYFLTDPSGLEQILLRDVMEHTGSTTVERQIQFKVVQQAEILRNIALGSAPPLKGYVRFDAKKDADMLLSIPGSEGKDDPLLIRWQYGLGRTAVFSSDAKARWAEAWVGWEGFDRFWANVLRDLLPHAQPGEAKLTHDAANGALVAEYRLAAGAAAPSKPPVLYVIGPDGFQRPVTVERAGEGYYRAVIPIGTRQGLFRVRPLVESREFPETGIYLPEQELSSYGNNTELLRQIAEFTGGGFNPNPASIFSTGGRAVPASLRLWPGLLALALLLNLAEVAWRKLKRT